MRERLTAIKNGFWRNTYTYAYEVLAKKSIEKYNNLPNKDMPTSSLQVAMGKVNPNVLKFQAFLT
jgi:hypothetical protein